MRKILSGIFIFFSLLICAEKIPMLNKVHYLFSPATQKIVNLLIEGSFDKHWSDIENNGRWLYSKKGSIKLPSFDQNQIYVLSMKLVPLAVYKKTKRLSIFFNNRLVKKTILKNGVNKFSIYIFPEYFKKENIITFKTNFSFIPRLSLIPFSHDNRDLSIKIVSLKLIPIYLSSLSLPADLCRCINRNTILTFKVSALKNDYIEIYFDSSVDNVNGNLLITIKSDEYKEDENYKIPLSSKIIFHIPDIFFEKVIQIELKTDTRKLIYIKKIFYFSKK